MKTITTALMIALFFYGCADAQTQKEKTDVSQNNLTTDYRPDAFSKALENSGAILIDVRTPGEYADGHLEDAVNIDWNGASFNSEVSKLDKNKPVYVYCAVGGRSSSAKDALLKMGFTEVHNMLGGIKEWSAKGLPVKK